MQIKEYLDIGMEPEIQISDGQIEVVVLHDRIKVLCDISGCGTRLSAGMDIKLDDFLDACARLKAEVESRSNGVAREGMVTLKKEDLQILSQAQNGALACHLGNDRYGIPVPHGRIKKLVKSGLLARESIGRYQTTQLGKLAMCSPPNTDFNLTQPASSQVKS